MTNNARSVVGTPSFCNNEALAVITRELELVSPLYHLVEQCANDDLQTLAASYTSWTAIPNAWSALTSSTGAPASVIN